MLERCQLEPLRLDQCQRQPPRVKWAKYPGIPPTSRTGAPGAADRTASADRRPEQQRTTRRRPGLFLLPIFHALPPARPAGSAADRPGPMTARPAR